MSKSDSGTSILESILSLVSDYEGNLKNLRSRLEEALAVVRKMDESKRIAISAKEEEMGRLRADNASMSKRLKDIEDQLSKVSRTYQELAGKYTEAVDVRELLTIYVTLLEQVFEGRPHAKILWLLHGKKAKLTREEINKSSGFQPAIVLKSIHDLANAELINYDEMTQELSLKRRLY